MTQPSRSGQARVLIVEDQPIIGLAIADALRELPAIPIGPITTFKEAIIAASRDDFELALLDVWLGQTPSFAIGDLLLARGIPFVIVSGAAKKEEPPHFQMAPRLFKPFTLSELRAAIDSFGGMQRKN